MFADNIEVVSWYSDGVRIVNVADPARPREIGFFVPPPRRDPQGFVAAPNRRLPTGRLVYASDENSGLWIVGGHAVFRCLGVARLPRS